MIAKEKSIAEVKQIHASLRIVLFSNSQILDNQSFSIFLFTNSLKSLPFSKFLEIKEKLCYPKMSEWVPVSIITKTSRLSSLAQTSNQSGLM